VTGKASPPKAKLVPFTLTPFTVTSPVLELMSAPDSVALLPTATLPKFIALGDAEI